MCLVVDLFDLLYVELIELLECIIFFHLFCGVHIQCSGEQFTALT